MKFCHFLRWIYRAVSLCFLLALAGCATSEPPFIPPPMERPGRTTPQSDPALLGEGAQQAERINFYQTPSPPAAIRTSAGERRPAASPATGSDDAIATVTLDNLPLPQFINVIYGAILKRNVSLDDQVAKRTDMVTFRTGKPQSAEQIFTAAQALLRSYGIVVQDYNGTLRVTPDNSQAGVSPEIRRGKASPDVPSSLRPVFYLVELEHVQIGQVSNWLKTLFQNRLTTQDDAQRNAILLSGQSDTVAAALEAIQMLDQPLMRGRVSARITPVFWSADEMARRLTEMLQAEGYAVASQATSSAPTLILPIRPINSIIVFASNEQVLNHVLHWAQEFDQSPQRRAGSFINYHVRNTDAADLAKTLGEVMGMSSGGTGGEGGNRPSSPGKVVVNPAANSIIIQTSPTEFQQWYALLQELDRPARNALIMATVAEVTLNDSDVFGFQWLLKQFSLNGFNVNVSTVNSVATGASDNTFRIGIARGSDPRALLTALATTDKIRILSNPSVMARNGQDATIQVGDEVPILTSQLSSGNIDSTSTGTSTGILQTVQYRSTGVILNVRPVIHAGGRIDLDVSQEVSTVGAAGIGGSPTISTRRIQTKLTVSDGNTLLLGGLMREEYTEGNAGIPFLKDIPVLGNVFRSNLEHSKRRTELVILLTTYVVEDDFDALAVTESFRNQFTWAVPQERPLALKPTTDMQPTETPLVEATSLRMADSERVSETAIEDAAAPAQNDVAPSKVEPAEAAKPVVKSAPGSEPYRSRPYLLPPPEANLFPMQGSRSPQPSPSISQDFGVSEAREGSGAVPEPAAQAGIASPAQPGTDSGAFPALPPGGKPVTDEALKQELLELFRKEGR